MSDEGAHDRTLYALALRLRVDIDDIALWPYHKINGWLAFFDAKERMDKR